MSLSTVRQARGKASGAYFEGDKDPIIPYRVSDRLYAQRTWYLVLGLAIYLGGGATLSMLHLV